LFWGFILRQPNIDDIFKQMFVKERRRFSWMFGS
jgi:hypothetical protein